MSTPRSADPKPKPGPPQQKARAGRPAPQERRALTHIGGATLLEGDPEGAAKLAHALDVASSSTAEEAARAHVHGFHSYPARMHPDTARRLIEGLSRPGERVLDPFCGSGTVLVEARLAGRAAIGVDANPLAVRLARLKVQGSTPGERDRLVAAAREVAAAADERRKARAGPSRRYGPEDVALFEPHVLLELDGLRVGLDRIAGHGADALRADLELVLSAILTKLSRRTSDTSEHELPRRIAAGYPARLFLRKAEELAQRLAEVATQLEASPPALVEEGDARVLRGVETGSVHLAITSPPYPGVYDYLAHHEARLRWLRLRSARFEQDEIGARRHLDPLGPEAGRARWRDELGGVLTALARVLRSGAPLVLLIADSVVAGAPVYAVDVVRAAASGARLTVRAVASQPRPHFHRPTARAFQRRPRHEHAILLIRA
ncbi:MULTISPECIES: DNA methyltransferase [Sorangium]|uniref:Methyltransferase n=1 Tax=Sorangium atrum TaxID=2995308 RepID=A0ABT5CDY7_9BACT|nr:DNA methyltransferase [Sorangium aterium]MDC0684664.1 DNA methyltransferase [Sorangium aterium]